MIYNYKSINDLNNFRKTKGQIGILKRKEPLEANSFFQELSKTPFSVSGFINQNNTYENINNLIRDKISKEIKCNPFYDNWLNDMANVCKFFCEMQAEESISFWLGSDRGCKRFHIDMVPYRLLVTYAGQGTEILPNKAANWNAFLQGQPNEDIVVNKSYIEYINKWDISIFRGGNEGILHRTPDSALQDSSSILMRLDGKSFLEEIKKVNVVA